jgi:hypothetical protein
MICGKIGMYENVITLKAPNERMLHVWFEPWAEGLGFPPGMVIELRASSLLEGQLEIDTTEERTAVYGWPGSTLEVFVNGEIVHSFDQGVPAIVTSLSVKETISMLFGPPPVPRAEEGATVRKRAWWRFWS